MKRRTALTLAAAALAETACNPAPEPPKQAALTVTPPVAKYRDKSQENRAHALALTVLLFRPQFQAALLADNPASPTYGGGGYPKHPFKKIKEKKIYLNMLNKFQGDAGGMKTKVRAASIAMMDLANYALAGIEDPYTDPDQCPCVEYDAANPGCAEVDPLLG